MKTCWLTEFAPDLYSLSLESDSSKDYQRMSMREIVFPDKNNKFERHVMTISLFGIEDLHKLYKALSKIVEIKE